MFRRHERRDGRVARVHEREALATLLGAQPAERELAVLHDPRPEPDRDRQGCAHRDDGDAGDAISHRSTRVLAAHAH